MRLGIVGGLVLAAGGVGAVQAQVPDSASVALAEVGTSAAKAWQARDFARLIDPGTTIQLRLPGADPSASVGQAQAVALLRAYVRGTTELSTEVRSAREVGPDRAFVDLRRHFRPDGTSEERVESVLLGYRRGASGWRLADLRVVPGA